MNSIKLNVYAPWTMIQQVESNVSRVIHDKLFCTIHRTLNKTNVSINLQILCER